MEALNGERMVIQRNGGSGKGSSMGFVDSNNYIPHHPHKSFGIKSISS